MMAGVPLISVVMGVFNGAADLDKTISSVLSQEGVALEFIVVDDGSTDGTAEILASWALRDSRLRVISQTNRGLTEALVVGCEAARGELIARQDCGDTSDPERLASQASYFRTDETLVAVFCDASFWVDEGICAYVAHTNLEAMASSFDGSSAPLGPAHHGTAMFRASAYRRVGGYRTPFRYAQDIDLWTRLAEVGSFKAVPTALYRARLEPKSISATRALEQRRLTAAIRGCIYARRNGTDESPCLDAAAQVIRRSGAKRSLIAAGNYFIGSVLTRSHPEVARGYFWRSVAMRPTHLPSWWKLAYCWVRS